MNRLHELYYAAVAADQAWQKELQHVFRRRAGNARYDQRGVSTPKLRQLHAAFRAAEDARHAAAMAG